MCTDLIDIEFLLEKFQETINHAKEENPLKVTLKP